MTTDEEEQPTYYIKRFYRPDLNKENHRVEGMEGLTLEEAKAHCQASSTPEWFDGFYKE